MNATLSAPVGLIGLGLLGSALAERLLAANVSLLGFDLRAERRTWLVEQGGSATDPGDLFARCNLVLLSLPTHREVEAVLVDADRMCPGGIIVDTTTGEPAASVRMAQRMAALGIAYLDGTISGSSEQTRRGEAVWMVGGDADALERCRAILALLGREIFATGPVGSGARMKLVTNLVLGLNRAALAEGLAFAEGLGLDAGETLRVLRASAAYSRIMDTKGEKMVTGDYTPQARLSQHLKDVRLILAEGDVAGCPLPLSTAHREILEQAETLGLGEMDNSALIEVLRRRGASE